MANESSRGNGGRSATANRKTAATAGSNSATQQQPAAAQPSPQPTGAAERMSGSRNARPRGAPPPVTNTVSHLPSSADREARRRRVAEAAYYRAQRRGFAPGGEVDDWLEAEKDIDNTDAGTDK